QHSEMFRKWWRNDVPWSSSSCLSRGMWPYTSTFRSSVRMKMMFGLAVLPGASSPPGPSAAGSGFEHAIGAAMQTRLLCMRARAATRVRRCASGSQTVGAAIVGCSRHFVGDSLLVDRPPAHHDRVRQGLRRVLEILDRGLLLGEVFGHAGGAVRRLAHRD